MDLSWEISKRLESHLETAEKMREILGDVKSAIDLVVDTFRNNGKILLAGNGGSAADAQHWAAEWVIRLTHHLQRPAMPAVALTTDTSIITAGGNDIGFENIFARQVEALGKDGDLLIVITTSGQSENLLRAAKTAREKGMKILGILGKDGGVIKQHCDLNVIIPSEETQHIQEMHEFVGHLLCELSELELYGS